MLVPASSCERCGEPAPGPDGERLAAHHHRGYDLEAVLDVQWLCRACHATVHAGAVVECPEVGTHLVTPGQISTEMQRRAHKGWETRRARYGPTGLSDTPRSNARR